MATRKPREAECREGAGYMITRYAHERQLQWPTSSNWGHHLPIMSSTCDSISGWVHWLGQSPRDPITSQKPQLWTLHWKPSLQYLSLRGETSYTSHTSRDRKTSAVHRVGTTYNLRHPLGGLGKYSPKIRRDYGNPLPCPKDLKQSINLHCSNATILDPYFLS
jgi:hypothetical protein